MDLDFGTKSNCNRQSRCGFALITALSLMAFMLVLVVTLLSLMEVETRSADNNLELQKAREGARLGLSMALGKLQEYAGDDRRVTARADIRGSATSEANHWTGVWDTNISNPIYTTPPSFLAWLISEHNPIDPDDAIDPEVVGSSNAVLNPNNSMELVGPNSVSDTSEYVRAPFTNILDSNGNISSRIAWWVGDEGTKASVAQLPLTSVSNRPKPNYTSSASANSFQTMLTTTQGLEEVFRFNTYNRFTSVQAQSLDRVTDIKQLFDSSGLNLSWPSPILEEAFHTLTPMSLGVLAGTTQDVGLMEDLSLFPTSISTDGASASSQNALRDYINNAALRALAKDSEIIDPVLSLQRSVSMLGSGTSGDGDIVNSVTPVLTNFMMAFSIFEPNDQLVPNSRLRAQFFCALWNPYTSSLQMDDLDLKLEITGLPDDIVVRNVTTGGQSAEINLQDLLGDPGNSDNALVIRLQYDQNENWLPGMTKNWIGIVDPDTSSDASPYISTETRSKDLSTASVLGGTVGIDTGVARVSTFTATPPADQIRILSNLAGDPVDTLNVKISFVNATDPIGAPGTFLTQITGIEYGAISTGSPPNPTESGRLFSDSQMSFGYHFVLRGPEDSHASGATYYGGDWLANSDPRSLNWVQSYSPVINGTIDQIKPADPHLLNSSTINIVTPVSLFDRSDGTGSYYDSLWQDSPLFEVPRERIFSLASLQHLHFQNERPFKVGNSWGDNTGVNTLSWFDKYFLSGLSPGDNLNAFQQHKGFPNPMLLSYKYTDANLFNDAPNSIARNALVANRFNINSTSVEAWKAVLGGLRIHNWGYLNYPESKPYPSELPARSTFANTDIANGDSRGALFARFADSLHETFDVPETPETSSTIARSEFYRRGARFLEYNQIGTLAQQIVNRIKLRGVPFLSMEQFLSDPSTTVIGSTDNQSLLEKAIESAVFKINVPDFDDPVQQWDRSWETTGIVDDDSDRIDIDHFSPGFLTQADIMTAIGPMLAPRSDTFRIRARCQTLSPFDSDEVIGDATIEALVQRVPTQLDPDDDIDNSIERRFEIISLRWLTEDEL